MSETQLETNRFYIFIPSLVPETLQEERQQLLRVWVPMQTNTHMMNLAYPHFVQNSYLRIKHLEYLRCFVLKKTKLKGLHCQTIKSEVVKLSLSLSSRQPIYELTEKTPD
jgi:hypothetical protein